ncbi:MAG: ribonuclease HII [Bdellovibrionaceae bacterium]|nr:ribonuclease HII [Pseudobdellovibrionaceae bacterium]
MPYEFFVGTDEVGRGCLAGPVVSCAVLFTDLSLLSEFKDSKTLSEKKREALFEELSLKLLFSVGIATVEEIDTINILQASLLSMKRAVQALELEKKELKKSTKKILLLDGNQVVPGLLGYVQAPVIKGDQKVSLISAASVIAKVYRDRLMKSLAVDFPNYGFEVHKGYATELHRSLIERNGPSRFHRLSFKGVKEYVL